MDNELLHSLCMQRLQQSAEYNYKYVVPDTCKLPEGRQHLRYVSTRTLAAYARMAHDNQPDPDDSDAEAGPRQLECTICGNPFETQFASAWETDVKRHVAEIVSSYTNWPQPKVVLTEVALLGRNGGRADIWIAHPQYFLSIYLDSREHMRKAEHAAQKKYQSDKAVNNKCIQAVHDRKHSMLRILRIYEDDATLQGLQEMLRPDCMTWTGVAWSVTHPQKFLH